MSVGQKYIVWDWNGTLFDDAEAMLQGVNTAFLPTGLPQFTIEKFRESQNGSIPRLLTEAGVTQSHPLYCKAAELSDIYSDHYEIYADERGLVSGAAEILEKFQKQNGQNYILSNHIHEYIEQRLIQHKIGHYFTQVMAYASRDNQFKHENKIDRLKKCIMQHNLAADNGIMIGDTTEDVETGKICGLLSIAVTHGIHSERRLRAAQPDYVIHSLYELQPILQERGFLS